MTSPQKISANAVRAIESGSDPLSVVILLSDDCSFSTPVPKEDVGRYPNARRLIDFAAPAWSHLFSEVDVPPAMMDRWMQLSDIPALEMAAQKMLMCNASPWMVIESHQWFFHYAQEPELRALHSFTEDEFCALLGEKFYPSTSEGVFQRVWRTMLPPDFHYLSLKSAGFTDEVQFGGSVSLKATVFPKSVPCVHHRFFDAGMNPGQRKFFEESVPLIVEIKLDLKGLAPAMVAVYADQDFHYSTDGSEPSEAFFDCDIRRELSGDPLAWEILKQAVAGLRAQQHAHAQAMGEGSPLVPADESGGDEDDDLAQSSRPRGG